MKIQTIKFPGRPEQEKLNELKRDGFSWEAGPKVWYKVSENGDGVECYVIPELTLSKIKNTSDADETRAKDARIKAEYEQKIQAIRAAVGGGEVWSLMVSSLFLVSDTEFPGAVKSRNLDRLLR